MTKKVLIKTIASAKTPFPGVLMELRCNDESVYTLPEEVASKSSLEGKDIAVLEEDGEFVALAKVARMTEGRLEEWSHLSGDKPMELDGTEEIVDCRV